MNERGPFYVRVIPPPDRSKYRHPPYWWPDTPIPELAATPTPPPPSPDQPERETPTRSGDE